MVFGDGGDGAVVVSAVRWTGWAALIRESSREVGQASLLSEIPFTTVYVVSLDFG